MAWFWIDFIGTAFMSLAVINPRKKRKNYVARSRPTSLASRLRDSKFYPLKAFIKSTLTMSDVVPPHNPDLIEGGIMNTLRGMRNGAVTGFRIRLPYIVQNIAYFIIYRDWK